MAASAPTYDNMPQAAAPGQPVVYVVPQGQPQQQQQPQYGAPPVYATPQGQPQYMQPGQPQQQQHVVYAAPQGQPQQYAQQPQQVVYVQQPAHQQHQQQAGVAPAGQEEFKVGFCSCFDHDISLCLLGTFCLPCLAGDNVERAKGDNCIVGCIAHFPYIFVLGSPYYRNKIRTAYNIRGDVIEDVVLGVCCPCCSVIQLANEIKLRGPSPLHPQFNAAAGAPPAQRMS